ncbi:MAG: hypothetical protein OXG18_02365 [Gemmatimonadetes bacterium]|nr:hypothetical protein [Gemmatimonadota bacterium]
MRVNAMSHGDAVDKVRRAERRALGKEGNGILLGTKWHWPRRKTHAEKLEWASGFGLEPLLNAARMIREHLQGEDLARVVRQQGPRVPGSR